MYQGGAKRRGVLARLEGDTYQSLWVSRRRATHPTGYTVMPELCDDPAGFVEAVIAE